MAAWPGHAASFFRQLTASYRLPTVGARRSCICTADWTTACAFLVRDDRQRPHFYVRAADAARAAAVKGLPPPQPVDKRTFAGEPVCRVDVEVPSDVPPLRDKLHAAGIETFEADVRFASRYLIERGIKGGCEIEGRLRLPAPAAWCSRIRSCIRPTCRSCRACCRSTSRRMRRGSVCWRYRCSAWGAMRCSSSTTATGRCPSEPSAARPRRPRSRRSPRRVRSLDPDVLTGWNLIDFDLSVLERIAARVGYDARARSRPGRHADPQGRRLFRQRPGEHPGTPRARRHRSACAARSSAWTIIRSMRWRAKCSAKARP